MRDEAGQNREGSHCPGDLISPSSDPSSPDPSPPQPPAPTHLWPPKEEHPEPRHRLPVTRLGRLTSELVPYLGPAFLVSVGYMDPGNWGTDIEAGSRFGYKLLWVIFVSNMMAVLLQHLSAKLGIATGRTLPECCRDHYSRRVNWFLWISGEFAAMMTDLAEFLGGALGFYLLFHIPMPVAALLTGAVVSAILALERKGLRKVEIAIVLLVAVINLSYVFEVLTVRPDWGKIVHHTFVPSLSSDSILIIVGIVGATVMPHNLYLHSALVQPRLIRRDVEGTKKLSRFAIVDNLIALNGAWFVNAAIMITSAAAFHGLSKEIVSIEEAHQTMKPLLGSMSATVFAIALLASGLSSSSTATMAGQVIMGGFLNMRSNIWVRRLVTMVPALVVIALGLNPVKVLVLSQVALSLQLPCAVIPLVLFTRRKELMGSFVNHRITNVLAAVSATVILSLNVLLLYQVLGGRF